MKFLKMICTLVLMSSAGIFAYKVSGDNPEAIRRAQRFQVLGKQASDECKRNYRPGTKEHDRCTYNRHRQLLEADKK
ncbi:MAG: hypothetical protein WD055_03635 [Candidatus Dependentiae bacterium]